MPRLWLLACILLLAACAPRLQPSGDWSGLPHAPATLLAEESWQAEDGRVLPLRRWLPQGAPRAVVIALHGFNDYGNAFAEPAAFWAARNGIATYAPDQRGFGASPFTGLWPGSDVLADDLLQLTHLLRRQHPGLPVYWLGESMGGAVMLAALPKAGGSSRPDGVALLAPAVWGRASMPLSYRMALALASHSAPWMKFSGRGLGIQASDNIPMLRRLGADPLVIKRTRTDAIHGLVGLMDRAAAAPVLLGENLPPLLVLYGLRDQVIPKPPVERFVAALDARVVESGARVALYDRGWHMLLRDLQAEKVWHDLAAWMADPAAPLPSGAETRRRPLFAD